MKPASLLLALSIAANAAGAVALMWFESHDAAESAAALPSGESAANIFGRPAAPTSTFWSLVDSDDPGTLVRHLRAAGMPADLVQALVAGLIKERYRERLAQARMAGTSGNYWERVRQMTPEDMRAYLAVQRERDDLIRSLLGDEAVDSSVELATAQRLYGLADPTKVVALAAIDRDYESLLSAYRTTGFLTKADQAAVALIEQERAVDLAALLTPDELFEYQLRRSDAANRLQRQLIYFSPTEAEYRELFPQFQAFNDAFPDNGAMFSYKASSGAEADAKLALAQSLGESFGTDRAAELAIALNPANSLNNAFVARLGLPLTVAGRLSEIQSSYEDLVRKMVTAGGQDPATQKAVRDAAAASLQEIETLLGPGGLAKFRDSTGLWVRGFDQLAAPPSTSPGNGPG